MTMEHRQPLEYNICNGLSNQLLYHSSSIAIAHQQNRAVEIPDYFIIDGVQWAGNDKDANVLPNVLPSPSNSIAFEKAFDKDYFRDRMETLGVNARFVTFNFDTDEKQPPCANMGSLATANPITIQYVLKSFKPSKLMQTSISIVNEFIHNNNPTSSEQGVCVHHRDGEDWHKHCQQWSHIPDGVYRGNCELVPNSSFLEALQNRGVSSNRWIYYCGDHEVPQELEDKGGIRVFSRNLVADQLQEPVLQVGNAGMATTDNAMRDVWALIDFFVCQGLDHFIGNSVSTFSALQIAIREGEGAYWYNSQSIPLGDVWNVYHIPIVYTYTEMSEQNGRVMLMTSIASVRSHMPANPIHILYHGNEDASFRSWLQEEMNVNIHQHDPSWRSDIEEMRQNGNVEASHLFLHGGNYFGTWQRIDIPHFLDTEYCLLLDADTVVVKPFGLSDFGLDLTRSIAMSSEADLESKIPWNAGVMLMNIPYLRRSYDDFLKYVRKHIESPMNFGGKGEGGPSDQGAYITFYASTIQFMKPSFNYKPYWPIEKGTLETEASILHFHGPKPNEYIRLIGTKKKCSVPKTELCDRAMIGEVVVPSLRSFASSLKDIMPLSYYCEQTFFNSPVPEFEIQFCKEFLETLLTDKARFKNLTDVEDLRQKILENQRMQLPIAQIPIAQINNKVPSLRWANQINDDKQLGETGMVQLLFGLAFTLLFGLKHKSKRIRGVNAWLILAAIWSILSFSYMGLIHSTRQGLENLSEVAFNQDMEQNQQQIMKYELVLLDLNPSDEMDAKKMSIYEKRISYLTTLVKTSKRRKSDIF